MVEALIVRSESLGEQVVQLGGKINALPAAIVRAVHTGEVE